MNFEELRKYNTDYYPDLPSVAFSMTTQVHSLVWRKHAHHHFGQASESYSR